MKLELFEEIQTTFCRYVRRFCELPIKGNPLSIAYQSYHFNCFKAMTNVLNDALLHLNYAQLYTVKDNIRYNTCFTLVLNDDHQIVRSSFFDKIDHDTQVEILEVVQAQIKSVKPQQLDSKTYIPIVCDCLNSGDKLCAIYGTLYVDLSNKEYIFNLNYFKVATPKRDTLISMNTNKKNKIEEIYTIIQQEPDMKLSRLLNILQVHKISLEEFELEMTTFYGDCLDRYSKKERILKSLELILFTKRDLSEIAVECGYPSSISLYRLYYKSNKLNNSPIIRYAN